MLAERIIHSEGEYCVHCHGSSLDSYGAPLDQERAASMADEGGVSGAETDAAEQRAAGIVRAHPQPDQGPAFSWWTWLLWGSLLATCAAIATSLVVRRR